MAEDAHMSWLLCCCTTQVETRESFVFIYTNPSRHLPVPILLRPRRTSPFVPYHTLLASPSNDQLPSLSFHPLSPRHCDRSATRHSIAWHWDCVCSSFLVFQNNIHSPAALEPRTFATFISLYTFHRQSSCHRPNSLSTSSIPSLNDLLPPPLETIWHNTSQTMAGSRRSLMSSAQHRALPSGRPT